MEFTTLRHSPELMVKVYPRNGNPIERSWGIQLAAGKDLIKVKIDKGQTNIGAFSIELADASSRWASLLQPGDFVEIRVDGKTKMYGIVNTQGYSASSSGGSVMHRVVIRGVDMGIMFSQYARTLPDAYWGESTVGALGPIFQAAYDATMVRMALGEYDPATLFRKSYEGLFASYSDVCLLLNARKFSLSDGSVLEEWWGRDGSQLFEGTVSDTWDLFYSMHSELTSSGNLWAFWQTVSDPPFNELWADTVHVGQVVDTFSKAGPWRAPRDGFKVICRPSPWIDQRFERMLANEIPDVKVESVEASRGSAEVKSVYLVYTRSDMDQQNEKASGNYAPDARLFGRYGMAAEEVALNLADGRTATGQTLASQTLALSEKLRDAFATIDLMWAGSVNCRYHDVRVGQRISFPWRSTTETRMNALATQVSDDFDYGGGQPKATTVVSFVRGDM